MGARLLEGTESREKLSSRNEPGRLSASQPLSSAVTQEMHGGSADRESDEKLRVRTAGNNPE